MIFAPLGEAVRRFGRRLNTLGYLRDQRFPEIDSSDFSGGAVLIMTMKIILFHTSAFYSAGHARLAPEVLRLLFAHDRFAKELFQ